MLLIFLSIVAQLHSTLQAGDTGSAVPEFIRDLTLLVALEVVPVTNHLRWLLALVSGTQPIKLRALLQRDAACLASTQV